MNPLELPWLELSIVVALAGSLCLSRVRDPLLASRWGIGFTGLTFCCAFVAWLAFYLGVPSGTGRWDVQTRTLGSRVFGLDELSAPLVAVVALLHFLTAVTTPRTRMRYFSFSWSLASEAIRLAMFGCKASWVLVALTVLCTVPPYLELRNLDRPRRVYALHMVMFGVLMFIGWAGVAATGPGAHPPDWAAVALLLAILIRSGTVPAHCWVTDWFEHASMGNGLLFVTPLAGVYAAVRLVLPVAPDWVLQGIGVSSLLTAVYAAGMACVQRDTRRFFAFSFLSHASIVLVGLELHTRMSLTGSLCLWFSVILSLGGFGLTLRAIESRVGRLSLSSFHGLYDQMPSLAAGFLLTGLACVGFPGTLGFISAELLVDSAVEASPYVGVAVVAAGALNGIAVLRAYFRLFTGAPHTTTVSLRIGLRERAAVTVLSALVIGGGLFPQPGVTTRFDAAEAVLADRVAHLGLPDEPDHEARMPQGQPPLASTTAQISALSAASRRSIYASESGSNIVTLPLEISKTQP